MKGGSELSHRKTGQAGRPLETCSPQKSRGLTFPAFSQATATLSALRLFWIKLRFTPKLRSCHTGLLTNASLLRNCSLIVQMLLEFEGRDLERILHTTQHSFEAFELLILYFLRMNSSDGTQGHSDPCREIREGSVTKQMDGRANRDGHVWAADS